MQVCEICQELRINLKEIDVTARRLAEAAAALSHYRGVQAIWVGGDNTALLALDSVIAGRARPGSRFFCCPNETQPGNPLGYRDQLLRRRQNSRQDGGGNPGGVDPATIPIPDKIPQKLVVNKQALKKLKDPGCFRKKCGPRRMFS